MDAETGRNHDFTQRPDKAPNRLKQNTTQLRILATTDLHMQLTGYNYLTHRTMDHHGLAGVASLIDMARTEAQERRIPCLLVDNGDMLQNPALGAWLADHPVTPEHPAAACLNALKYDAVGIGNHDLDYGLTYLQQIGRILKMPLISSNLQGSDLDPLVKSAILQCPLSSPHAHDQEHVNVGILSVLPAQTAIWNRHLLEGIATVESAQSCLAKAVPKVRKEGAEIVIVLAHMGFAEDPNGTELAEDTAPSLTKIPGIDAMIMGHTHRRFPLLRAGYRSQNKFTENPIGIPAVMPGHSGSDLAVLDLTLSRRKNGNWNVVNHRARLRQNNLSVQSNKTITQVTAPTQHRLTGHLAAAVGHTNIVLHNYFSAIAPTSTGLFSASAKARIVKDALRNTYDCRVPILATASAHTAGGREGPQNYLHFPKGSVLRRHLSGLDPYANQIWAVKLEGAQIRRWLEHSARIFNSLNSNEPEQALIRSAIPTFNFDTIYGVEYKIDPTRPIGSRITALCWNGIPISPDQQFILATNQFRAAGSGGYEKIAQDRVVFRYSLGAEHTFIKELNHANDPIWNSTQPWSFQCATPIKATFLTSPLATPFLPQIAQYSPQPVGMDETGFARFQLTL